jgi:beta-lactamase regulating signal transducer with metallopeptidase domain
MSARVVEALGWTLVGSLWQGALIAVLFAMVWLIARKWTAAARYGVCAATLLLLALTPAITFALLLWPEGSTPVPLAAPAFRTFAWQVSPVSLQTDWRGTCESAFPGLCAVWLCGVLALALRRAGGWLWLMRSRTGWQSAPPALVARLKSLTARAGIGRMVSLRVALSGVSPFVVGWLRPMILIPAATLAGTHPDDLEALLVHELAHIRRHDYLVNLLQMAVETVLFYHPFLWWVSRQMRIEREHCCDDLAVRISGDPARYARALVELAGRQAASEFVMAATGGSLSSRIRRLLFNETPSSRPPAWAALVLAMVAVAVVIAADKSNQQPQSTAQHAKPAAAALSSDKRSAFPEAPEAAKEIQVAEGEDAPEAPDPPQAPDPPETPSNDDRGEWLTAMMHSGLHHLTIEQLIELRTHGVTPEMARAAVHENPDATPGDVEELAIHGVTAEYVDAMHALVSPSITLKDLVKMQIHGVTPDYVKEISAALETKPSAEDLIKMKIHGVDPDFAERVKHNGFPNVSIEQLIRMRIAGL